MGSSFAISWYLRAFLADFQHRLDSLCFQMVRNYCWHHDYAFDLALVDPPRPPRSWGLSSCVYNILFLACVLVDTPAWFSSTRSIDCKSKKDGTPLSCRPPSRMNRTSTWIHWDRLAPFRPPRMSRWWRRESRKCLWSERCSHPPTCLFAGRCSTVVWFVALWLRCLWLKPFSGSSKLPLAFWRLGVLDVAQQLITDTGC